MLMRGGFLLYLVFIITSAESRSNRNVIDIHIESENDNQGGANLKSTECQCEKRGGYCIKNGDHCNGTIEILHDSGDDQCCCCLPKPRESTECQCEKRGGVCIKNGDHCNGTIEILHDSADDQCCCCITKPRESTEYQCEKMGGFCIENGDHCNGTIEILHNSGDDQCCCCIPKREPTDVQCKKMDGFCVESGDICTGIMEILYNSYDDHCCCCISFTPDEYGICTVWGDPHFITSADGGVELKYDIMAAGNFLLTKYGTGSSPIFKVTSTFYNCGIDHTGRPISCIEDVTYYEDGYKIKLSLLASPGTITIMEPPVANPSSGTIGLITYYLVNYVIKLPSGTSGNYPCMHVDGSKGIKVIFCYVAGNYGIIDILYKFNPSLKNLPGLCDWRDSRTEDFAENWKIRSARDTVGEVEPIVPKTNKNILERCAVDSELLKEVNRRCDKSMPHDAFKFLPAWDYKAYREACTFDLCHLSNNTGYEEGYAVHMGILGQLFYK